MGRIGGNVPKGTDDVIDNVIKKTDDVIGGGLICYARGRWFLE